MNSAQPSSLIQSLKLIRPTLYSAPEHVADSQWGLVPLSLGNVLQSWQFCYLPHRWGAVSDREPQPPTQIVVQKLRPQKDTKTFEKIRKKLDQWSENNCCELIWSPAGSESPHKGHCWRTAGFSTSPSSEARLWSHPAGSQTDTPEHEWDAASHLMEEWQIHSLVVLITSQELN